MTVKYFGKIAELTEANSEEWKLLDISISGFRKSLFEKYPILENETLKIAVNLKFENDSFVIKQNDTIAVLPPFSGG